MTWSSHHSWSLAEGAGTNRQHYPFSSQATNSLWAHLCLARSMQSSPRFTIQVLSVTASFRCTDWGQGPCRLLYAKVFSASTAGGEWTKEKQLLGERIFLVEKAQKGHSLRSSRPQGKVSTVSTQPLPSSVQKKLCCLFHVLFSGIRESGSAPPFIRNKCKFKVD